ncbi:MAG: hypothetical protein R3C03_19675, partial [Pirellulaceae bacterium]
MRVVEKTYRDPVELIWIEAARQLGIAIERSSEVFAHWNGNGTLVLGSPETLDGDDCLAQMIFHEMCHALVCGPEWRTTVDWGLDNDVPEHQVFEHASLRLQAALSAEHGLNHFMAATTDFREFYDRIVDEPWGE